MQKHLIKNWLPLAVASTVIMVTVYAAVQQEYRQSANDPQIQLAEDGAAYLSAGVSPTALFAASGRVDMHASLASFAIVYDDSGKPVAASGYLNGTVPQLPAGVIDYARTNVTDRITWQPASTTRVAAIVRHYRSGTGSTTASGFIVTGRNIREIESREHQLALIVGFAWLAIMVLTLLVSIYSFVAERREKEIRKILEA